MGFGIRQPHTRGENFAVTELGKHPHRNTPTYVGRTSVSALPRKGIQKHPHVCGENLSKFANDGVLPETPPRMWGEPSNSRTGSAVVGNTPTYVGRTPADILPDLCSRKHPHVCGENFLFSHFLFMFTETPPRMWGEQYAVNSIWENRRNTPTYVGRTSRSPCFPLRIQKHPHVCGENELNRQSRNLLAETPPRMWGEH